MNRDPFFISTAISYPNGKPHIGHAYELIATDALARFARLSGRDVFFLTGTDEHGIKMLQTARDRGVAPEELAAENTAAFQAMAHELNASNDAFIRTSEARHHQACQALWKALESAGDIYLGSYSGWYSVRDEAYYQEEETVLEEGGRRLGPQGTEVEWVEEESYFFRLSAFQDRLLAHYESHPEFIAPPERRNEIASFVRSGLTDLSISRTSFDWGVKVPGNDAHVMYVWIDALTNYITAIGYPDTDAVSWKYWPAALHVIGKDITRFHAVYWPAFLMSAGLELPERIFSHGFVFNRGEKMSKSLGNVVDPAALIETYGLDSIRYFFLREVPFGQDGNYSHEAIVGRINSDLANDLGNLAQRSLSMMSKNCGGAVPEPGPYDEAAGEILAMADALYSEVGEFVAEQKLHLALTAIFRIVSATNRYFAGQEPWALKKSDPQKMAMVLYVTADVIRQVAILCQPVMPESASRLLDLLAIPEDERDFSQLGDAGRLKPGVALPEPVGVFPRFRDEDAN